MPSYVACKFILPHLDYNTRFQLSKRCPQFDRLYKKIPFRVKNLQLSNFEMKVNNFTYRMKLFLHFPKEETLNKKIDGGGPADGYVFPWETTAQNESDWEERMPNRLTIRELGEDDFHLQLNIKNHKTGEQKSENFTYETGNFDPMEYLVKYLLPVGRVIINNLEIDWKLVDCLPYAELILENSADFRVNNVRIGMIPNCLLDGQLGNETEFNCILNINHSRIHFLDSYGFNFSEITDLIRMILNPDFQMNKHISIEQFKDQFARIIVNPVKRLPRARIETRQEVGLVSDTLLSERIKFLKDNRFEVLVYYTKNLDWGGREVYTLHIQHHAIGS